MWESAGSRTAASTTSSAADSTAPSVYEEAGEESLYDLGVGVATLRAAAKGHSIADYVQSDALAEQCEQDYKRFVDDWPRIVAELARRASVDQTSQLPATCRCPRVREGSP